jgi:hypothetical protein
VSARTRELRGQFSAALRGLDDVLGQTGHPFRIFRTAADQVEVAVNSLKKIVEVVGQSARQLPNSLFLAVTERLLAPLIFRDIPADGVENSSVANFRDRRPGERDGRAVRLQ